MTTLVAKHVQLTRMGSHTIGGSLGKGWIRAVNLRTALSTDPAMPAISRDVVSSNLVLTGVPLRKLPTS